MKKFLALGSVVLVAAGCTPEMEASMAEAYEPKVVNVTSRSVTIARPGNSMWRRDVTAADTRQANTTCQKMGKSRAEYQSAEYDNANTDYNTNHYLFLCL